MPWPSTGEKLPLVTTPTGSPSTSTAHSARGGRRPSVAMPTQRGGRRRARARRPARPRPRNVGLPHATTQPSPACSGVMPGPSSWPCSGSAASRRSVSRAPSPAGHDAGAGDRGPQVGCGRGGHGDLDAALAGVAGAGDDARRRPSHVAWPTRNRPTAAASGNTVRQPLAWPADPARRAPPARAVVSRPPIAARTRSVFDAFGITSNTSSPSPPPHDDVVEHRARRPRRAGGCTAPARAPILAEVVGQRALQRARRRRRPRPGPCRGATRRTRRRRCGRPGARRSCRSAYASGMSQPPNGTIRAPSARCTASSGDCARAASAIVRSPGAASPSAAARRRRAARAGRRGRP